MRDEGHPEDVFDAAAGECMAHGGPEHAAIIGEDADAQSEIEGEDQPAPDVPPRQLGARRRLDAVCLRRLDLVAVARKDAFGRVAIGDRAAPARQHLVMRAQEAHIRFEIGIVKKPPGFGEAIP